jgi:hypothetical protein
MGIDIRRLMGEVIKDPDAEDRNVEMILNLLLQALIAEQPVLRNFVKPEGNA